MQEIRHIKREGIKFEIHLNIQSFERSREYDVSEIKYLNSSLLAIVFFQTELNRAVYVHCVGKDVIEKVVI